MENSGTCEICNVIVHRASMQKHLRSEKHLEKITPKEMINENGYLNKSKHLLRKKYKKYIILKH